MVPWNKAFQFQLISFFSKHENYVFNLWGYKSQYSLMSETAASTYRVFPPPLETVQLSCYLIYNGAPLLIRTTITEIGEYVCHRKGLAHFGQGGRCREVVAYER